MERDQETVVLEGFQGRVTVNQTNGFLTLGPLATTDSGNYYVSIYIAKRLKSGVTNLQVLGKLLGVMSLVMLAARHYRSIDRSVGWLNIF